MFASVKASWLMNDCRL